MALLAISLVTGMFSSGFDWFYPVRVLGTAAVIWFFWRSRLTRLHLAGIWSGSAIAIGVGGFRRLAGSGMGPGECGHGSRHSRFIGRNACWIGGRLADIPGPWVGHHGTHCRGIGLPGVCPAPVDFTRLRQDLPPLYLAFLFVVVLSVRRPARTMAGRDRGGDVLCLGDVPAGQDSGCHSGPCDDERTDRRGGAGVGGVGPVGIEREKDALGALRLRSVSLEDRCA